MTTQQTLLLTGVLLCLCFLLVGVAGGEQIAATNDSVALQDPAGVAVADTLGGTSGEAELVVELPDHEGAATADQFQTHAAASQATLRQFAARSEAVTVERQFWLTNAALVRVDTDRLPPRALARIEGVESVRPNSEFQTLKTQTDTGAARAPAAPTAVDGQNATASVTSATYGLEQIRTQTAWEEYDTQGAGVSVAVLDTGVNTSHPDIDLAGWAEFEGDGSRAGSSPQDFDPSGHGTHVSGTVAGGAASGQQIGVAPAVDLYHGAALTDCTQTECTGTFSQIVAGMEWAVANDVDVLSMSLGADGYNSGLIDPVENAQDAGTTVVAASGNRGEGTSDSPANIPGTIGVGASNGNEDIASFSSGEQIDTSVAWGSGARAGWPDSYASPTIAAPGSAIESAAAGGGYDTKSGTSMATPHVAGAVALLQSVTGEQLSPAEMVTALETTATKPGDAPAPAGQRDTRYGAGIIDVPAALASVDSTLSAAFSATQSGERTVAFDAGATTGAVEYKWDLTGDGAVDDTGERVTFEFWTAGTQTVTLTAVGADGTTASVSQSVRVSDLPPVGDAPPRDLDGDGLYRDIRGDGNLTILDVQTLFNNLGSDVVQSNSGAFNFDGANAGEIDILDVQALFNDLPPQ